MGCSRPLDTYYQVGLLAQIGNKKRHLKTYLPSILLHIHWWLNVLYHVTQHFKMAPFRTLLIFCVEKTEIVQMPWCSKWCSATLNTTKASCKLKLKQKRNDCWKNLFSNFAESLELESLQLVFVFSIFSRLVSSQHPSSSSSTQKQKNVFSMKLNLNSLTLKMFFSEQCDK